MAIYAVVPFGGDDADNIMASLLSVDKATFGHYAPSIYFVRFPGTAQQLSEKVGFGGNTGRHGIVMEVGKYYGFATQDTWDWMNQS